MKHILYMTHSESGRYYIGRHSTKDINDGYLGSGRWVRDCKRSGTPLQRTILAEFNTVEELLIAEEACIKNHFDDSLCMNFLPTSRGFNSESLKEAWKNGLFRHRSQKQVQSRRNGAGYGQQRGTRRSEECKKLLSMKARARQQTKCPHCEKEGPKPQMIQWHFDNCKERTVECD